MDREVTNVKLRRPPNGKIYAVHNGTPLRDEDGGLRYFNTEADAWGALQRDYGESASAS